jgi:hypothetical protein
VLTLRVLNFGTWRYSIFYGRVLVFVADLVGVRDFDDVPDLDGVTEGVLDLDGVTEGVGV